MLERYARVLAHHATKVIRFPDDVPALSEDLGIESPLRERRHKNSKDPRALSWCAKWWNELEAARWVNTPETRT